MSRTLTELRDDLATGRTTPVALTEEALARAQANEGEGARVFTRLPSEAPVGLMIAGAVERAPCVMGSR